MTVAHKNSFRIKTPVPKIDDLDVILLKKEFPLPKEVNISDIFPQ